MASFKKAWETLEQAASAKYGAHWRKPLSEALGWHYRNLSAMKYRKAISLQAALRISSILSVPVKRLWTRAGEMDPDLCDIEDFLI